MRIAIANDTPMAVEALRRVVLSVPEHEIIWVAENGQQAVELAMQNLPDLILMDLIMPVLDGVQATSQIMQQSPCAILVVTSCVTDNSGKVFDAMGAGAMDAVNTPVLVVNDDTDGAGDLLKKIYTMGLLLNHKTRHSTKTSAPVNRPAQHNNRLLVIGASTGGPKALATLLAEFPLNFPVPIVIVQHVDKQFVQGLADWLNDQTTLPVQLAVEDDRLEAGTVYVADSDRHLQISTSGKLFYQDEPKHYIHKPSVSVLFESVAQNWVGQAIGVLLTGMGKDGAAGLLAMRDHGFFTVAQDEESCAVYGMPKMAVKLDAAEIVLSLNEIGPALRKLFAPGAMSQDTISPGTISGAAS